MTLVNKKDAVEVARAFLDSHETPDGRKLLVVDVRAKDDGLHVTYMVLFTEVRNGCPSEGLEVLAREYAAAFCVAHPIFAGIPIHAHYQPV
jgi:hypothetical protein